MIKATFTAQLEFYIGQGQWGNEDKGSWTSTVFNSSYIISGIENKITIPTVDYLYQNELGYYNESLSGFDFSRSFISIKNANGEEKNYSISNNEI